MSPSPAPPEGGPAADLAVVGAGAAGLAAAIRSARSGIDTVVLERDAAGGGARRLARVETWPGHPVGLSGAELVERCLEGLARFGGRLVTGARVTSLEARDGAFRLEVSGGEPVAARAVLLAMGAGDALPPLPGLPALLGAGVYACLPGGRPLRRPGGDVVVSGAAGTGARLALSLAASCRTVTVVGLLTPRHGTWDRPLPANLRLRPHDEVVDVAGVDQLEAVVLRDGRRGRVTAVEAAALYLVVRPEPSTEWLPPQVPRDRRGRVLTGTRMDPGAPREGAAVPSRETGLPGVFAAGAVRRGCPGGAAAMGDGIAAALEIEDHLIRSRAAPPPLTRERLP